MATVHVTLIDAGTQRVLGEAALAVEQLPASFAAPTTLHLGDDDWQVVHAEPVTRDEYVARGALRLQLRRIERIDPHAILFSLPTLEGAAPPTTDAAVPDDAVPIHPDDWRQVELIAARLAAEIAAELADIHAIFAEHRRGAGFAKLHVRSRIPEPLAGAAIQIAELAGLGERCALAIGGSSAPDAVIDGGFAFVADTGVVYGREAGGVVVALGLMPGSDPAPLRALARAHELRLVSWCTGEPPQ
ncbi:MAG TPA: hypothetical protein VFP84_21235 [Kofleriaceae bacterium]|nr:hypothetical protein [Kofleriaceae bacterium]